MSTNLVMSQFLLIFFVRTNTQPLSDLHRLQSRRLVQRRVMLWITEMLGKWKVICQWQPAGAKLNKKPICMEPNATKPNCTVTYKYGSHDKQVQYF